MFSRRFNYYKPICRHLMSVPGVGPPTALAFRATVDQPRRFRQSRDFAAHLGLLPREYQLGETDVQRRVSQYRDDIALTLLYEAAHMSLTRSPSDPRSTRGGMGVAKRRGLAKVRLAVARKLAVLLHPMWSDQIDLRWGHSAAGQA